MAPTSLSLIACRAAAVLAGAAISLAALAGPTGLLVEDAPEGLMRPSADIHGFAATSGLDARQDVVRARFVTLDDTLIATPREASSAVTLNLFDDVSLDVVFTRTEPGLNVDRILVGHVDGMESSYAVMVETGGNVWMDVWTLDAGQYQIRNAGGDVHLVAQVGEMPGLCGTDDFPADVDGLVVDGDRGGDEGDRNGDNGDLIDILIYYTSAARAQAGSVASIENAMNGWMATSNVYYANSQMVQRIRLVYMQETTYVEASAAQGDIVADRDRFRIFGDGFMDEVHDQRNFYGADLCHLVSRSNTGSICGIAASISLSPSLGFAVTQYACGASTFAHELGHNMGCSHDRQNAGGFGIFCYSFGYRTQPNGGLRTIMAYAPGSQIPYFSNPDITVSGVPIGISQAAGCANATAADNSRAMDETRFTVANYRKQQVGNPPPADFNILDPEDGAVGVNTQPVLDWQDAEFALTYDIVLSDEADLSPVLFSETGLSISEVLLPPAILESCTDYYWQVTAVGFGGETIGSPTVAVFTTRLVGDVNGSGMVDFADLNQLVFAYGQTGPGLPTDLDDDEDVDFADLNLLLSNYNLSCN